MAFMQALSGALRPRATGQASTAGVLPEQDTATTVEEHEPSTQEKKLMLHLSNVSHGVNHFQNQIMTMLYPAIMA